MAGTASNWLPALLVGLFGVANCGRVPSAPTVSPPVSLNASAAFVLVGNSISLSALHAETGEHVTVTWRNLTPSIASIDGNQLTGLQNGVATIVIGGTSSTPSLSIRVIANFNGWYPGRRPNGDVEIGSAYAIECVEFSRGWCSSNVLEERLGRGPEPFAMHLVQDRDAVTGDVYVRCGNASVTGTISEAGQLVLRGSFGLKGPPRCPIEEWSTALTDGGRALQGRFKYSSRINDLGGLVTMELRGVPRSP